MGKKVNMPWIHAFFFGPALLDKHPNAAKTPKNYTSREE
jgi:hypothetical protein